MKKEFFEGYEEKGMGQGWQYSIPNPMHQTEFERSLSQKEIMNREEATKRYVRGIQGKDGGRLACEEENEMAKLPLDISRNTDANNNNIGYKKK